MVIGRFYPKIGGAERQAQLLAKHLIDRGIDVEVITKRPRGVPATLPSDPVPIRRLWIPGFRWIKDVLSIFLYYRTLVKDSPQLDIIHAHLAYNHAYAAVLAGEKEDIPTIVKCGNSGYRFSIDRLANTFPFGNKMANYITQNADCFIAMNSLTKRQLMGWGVDENRIVNIPNGIEVTPRITSKEKIQAKKELGISSDEYIIIGVGSLKPKKDFETLIRGVGYSDLEQCIFLLGEGNQKSYLKKLAKELDIASQVKLFGWVPRTDIRKFVSAGDIFVLPSRVEGISNALLEAMMFGLPCIVSDIPGNRAVVNHHNTGLLFKAGNYKDLSKKIELLQANPTLAATLGNHGREHVINNFDMDLITEKYISLYKDLLNWK